MSISYDDYQKIKLGTNCVLKLEDGTKVKFNLHGKQWNARHSTSSITGKVIGIIDCKKNTIYEDAVELFGVHSQLDQAIQEASELIMAISKYKLALEDGCPDKIALKESDLLLELADNRIMSKQLMLIINFTKKDLRAAIKCKLNKLANYIKTGVKLK